MTININNNQELDQFVKVIVNNINNFIDFSKDNKKIVESFMNSHQYLINNIKRNYKYTGRELNSEILISEFWTKVDSIGDDIATFELIYNMLCTYYNYFDLPHAKINNNIIIQYENNIQKIYYDIDYFNSANFTRESLNNFAIYIDILIHNKYDNLHKCLYQYYLKPIAKQINILLTNININDKIEITEYIEFIIANVTDKYRIIKKDQDIHYIFYDQYCTLILYPDNILDFVAADTKIDIYTYYPYLKYFIEAYLIGADEFEACINRFMK